MRSKQWMVLLLAAVMGGALAAEQSPASAYVGADVGTTVDSRAGTLARAYAGYNVGASRMFGREQTHALELMVFSGRDETQLYQFYPGLYAGGNRVRTAGLGLNWTTATRIDDNWTLTTRLGGNYAWSTTRYAGSNQRYTYDRPGMTLGVGVAYKLNPHVSVTLDLTYMPINLDGYEKSKSPTLGTGLRYHF